MEISTRNYLNIRQELYIIWIFIKRDFILKTYFKVSYISNLLDTLTLLVIYGIIAKHGQNLDQFGININNGYVIFIISGIIINTLLATAVSSPYQGFMELFWSNRLELILISPIRMPIFIIGISLSRYIDTIIRILIYLIGGMIFLDFFIYVNTELLYVFPLLLFGLISCTGLGLLAASSIYLFDARGGQDPFRFAIEILSGLVAGVYFPVQILPDWAHKLSLIIPHTYVIDGLRRAFYGMDSIPPLKVHSIASVSPIVIDIIILICFSFSSLYIGWKLFTHGMELARLDGRLSRWQ